MAKSTPKIETPWIKGITGAAQYCGVSERTIHKWINQGHLKSRNLSKRMVIFRREDLDAAIESISERFDEERI